MGNMEKISIEEVETFERLNAQLFQLHFDVTILSKKSPDAPLKKFKLGVINEKISTANKLLTDSYMPIKMFELFDEDELPSNSDVVLVLTQYIEALELWRSSHLVRRESSWYWDIKGEARIYADGPDMKYRANITQ